MKKILYILIGLVAIYIVLCLFGPSNVKVERSIDINTSADIIKSKIIDLKFFHSTWSPWTEKDPAMKVTYTGETGKEGNSMSWESDKKEVGKGTMTYKYTHGDTIMESLYFEGQGEAQIYHVVSSVGNASKVTWIMQNSVPFPFRAMMLFMNIDKMVGPDFEKGLSKLKTAMESLPAESTAAYDIKEIAWEAKTYIGKKGTFKFNELSTFFASTYPKLAEFAMKNKVELTTKPSAIYFKYDEAKGETECAAVFGVKTSVTKEWETFSITDSKALVIEYYGAYEKSANAHYAMDAYMKEKGLTQSYVIEEYVTDPMTEKDTAKWLTNIIYIIK